MPSVTDAGATGLLGNENFGADPIHKCSGPGPAVDYRMANGRRNSGPRFDHLLQLVRTEQAWRVQSNTIIPWSASRRTARFKAGGLPRHLSVSSLRHRIACLRLNGLIFQDRTTLNTDYNLFMGNESSKARNRRTAEGYFDRIFVGAGIDIGCGPDPVTPDCVRWDIQQGDAQYLQGVADAAFDWVYSSHCLEHLVEPYEAVRRWWEVLKPGGKLLIVVPDEDLYEQGHWPSRFNGDHKWTFTIDKDSSWSPRSINLVNLIATLPNRKCFWIRTLDSGYDYSGGVWDRTLGPAEAQIEVLLEKQMPAPTAT